MKPKKKSYPHQHQRIAMMRCQVRKRELGEVEPVYRVVIGSSGWTNPHAGPIFSLQTRANPKTGCMGIELKKKQELGRGFRLWFSGT
jgi:hypothetical protein